MKYLCIGLYDDDGGRCADSYDTETPEEAEMLFEEEYPGVECAGVIELRNGEMVVVL